MTKQIDLHDSFRVIAAELSMSDPNIELDLLTDIEEARKSIEKTLIKAYFDTRKKIPAKYVLLPFLNFRDLKLTLPQHGRTRCANDLAQQVVVVQCAAVHVQSVLQDPARPNEVRGVRQRYDYRG